MAICEKCGKKYFQEKCPYCQIEKLEKNSEKTKNILEKIKKFIEDIIFEKEKDEQKKVLKKRSIDKNTKGYKSLYKENRKKAFEENRKERYKRFMKDAKEKGIFYEKYVANYFEKKGYKVDMWGMNKGKKDEGIDLIAKKEKELLFIQCKNWSNNNKHKISFKDISSFVGRTLTFIEKHNNYKNYNIFRLFIASNDIFDYSAKQYCKENANIVKYKILKIE